MLCRFRTVNDFSIQNQSMEGQAIIFASSEANGKIGGQTDRGSNFLSVEISQQVIFLQKPGAILYLLFLIELGEICVNF